METPIDIIVAAQWYGVSQWLRFVSVGMNILLNVQKQAASFGEHPAVRLRDAVPRGADWFDCYGKRCHDINVERV